MPIHPAAKTPLLHLMFSVSIPLVPKASHFFCIRQGLFDTFLADKPSVKIVRVDGGSVLEDGISTLSLSCISESNPPAQVNFFLSRMHSIDILKPGHVEPQRTWSGLDAPIYRGQCLHFPFWKSHTLPLWIHQHLLRFSSSSP